MCVCVCLGMCLKSVCMYIWSPFVSFTEIYTGTYIIDTTNNGIPGLFAAGPAGIPRFCNGFL